MEVSYKMRKVPTSIWLLVYVQTFTRYWYNSGVQPCLYDGMLIREFVDIHNVVTNLMIDTNYLGYFMALSFWVIG